MNERHWIVSVLRITGLVFFFVAALGLVVFIWGSVSPGSFSVLRFPVGLRPAGLGLLVGGFCGGLIFMGHAEMIRLLKSIADRKA
jgi:hypothetical protein